MGNRTDLPLCQPRGLEVIGIAATGAKQGITTCHFWVGAIPTIVFLAIFIMPFYCGSKARSVPEYIKCVLMRGRADCTPFCLR